MSARGLIVLAAVLAALIGALVWLGRSAESPAESHGEAPLVRAFTEDAVRSIEIVCGESTVAMTRTSPSAWRLAQPVDAEADPRRVHELLDALHDARVKKAIADDASGADSFGLAPPACTVRLALTAGPAPLTLRLGRASPIGPLRYAAGDDDRVVLTDGSLFGVVDRGADVLRERRLFPVDPEDIERIVVDRPSGRLALAMASGGWRIEEPEADAAASSACGALAKAVTSLELIGSDAVHPPESVHPSRRLRVDVTVRGAGSPRVALIAAAGIDGTRFGWRDDGGLSGVVAESAVRELERSWESFRETRIASFSLPDARALTIDRGGRSLRFVRAGETSPWSGTDASGPIPVDGARLTELLEKLRGLSGDGFAPRRAESATTGTIVVSGENKDLARLAWGTLPPEPGSNAPQLWITTPERPGAVFRIEAGRFEPIPASASDVAPVGVASAGSAGGS